MKVYNNRYRGFIISITEISEDKVEYKILNLDKSLLEFSEGYCIDVHEAMATCKEVIDDLIELR